MKMNVKVCSGVLALAALLPGSALAAYHSTSDSGVDALDYIENNRRLARENALDADQQQLLKDTADMKAHLHQPLDATKPIPVAVEGDDLSYDERTGAVYAKGNVKITELDQKRFLTDEANGNLKKQDVDVAGKAHMLQLTPGAPRVNITGYKTQYNYGTQTGKMEDVSGKVDHQFVKGSRMEFYPKEVIIYNGTATKCGATKPHYHLSAEKIEIWPNQKMIMHKVKFWLGNVVIAKRELYEADLRPEAKGPVYPRIGYSTDDGVTVEQTFEQPVRKNVTAYADARYAGKWGFRSTLGTRWNNAGSSYNIVYGYFEDGNNHWIKKQPSFIYSYGNHIGKTPYSYSLNYEIGRWYNNGIHSTHRYYGIGLAHDPIKFNKNFTLYLSTGYSITDESYNDSRVSGFSYDATLTKDFNDRWAAYTGYHYSKSNSQNSVFNYDTDDYSKKFETGFSYRFDDKNRIVVGTDYDVEGSTLKDVDYYWYHDIHCAQMIVRYREKRNTWHVGFQFTPW